MLGNASFTDLLIIKLRLMVNTVVPFLGLEDNAVWCGHSWIDCLLSMHILWMRDNTLKKIMRQFESSNNMLEVWDLACCW